MHNVRQGEGSSQLGFGFKHTRRKKMKARDIYELVKNPRVGLAVLTAAVGLSATGCASYGMVQDANGTRVQAQSVDGFGIGAAASGIGDALSGVADIVGAGKGHHPHGGHRPVFVPYHPHRGGDRLPYVPPIRVIGPNGR